MKKQFNGKAIYQPSGKAGEYSKWACNLYNGCTGRCSYCYNRHGITAKVLGADTPALKKSLVNYQKAQAIFMNELDQNQEELQKEGLHFNFVSDPCLKETYELNKFCMWYCLTRNVPVKILTKQIDWVEDDLLKDDLDSQIWGLYNVKHLFAIGFTLTGHDELEPGCSPNEERVRTMKVLYDEGFRTWASIEPIIDFESSLRMIRETVGYCDLYKIGLQSGSKHPVHEVQNFINQVARYTGGEYKIYFKDSILKAAKFPREELPEYCVTADFNIFDL